MGGRVKRGREMREERESQIEGKTEIAQSTNSAGCPDSLT